MLWGMFSLYSLLLRVLLLAGQIHFISFNSFCSAITHSFEHIAHIGNMS